MTIVMICFSKSPFNFTDMFSFMFFSSIKKGIRVACLVFCFLQLNNLRVFVSVCMYDSAYSNTTSYLVVFAFTWRARHCNQIYVIFSMFTLFGSTHHSQFRSEMPTRLFKYEANNSTICSNQSILVFLFFCESFVLRGRAGMKGSIEKR